MDKGASISLVDKTSPSAQINDDITSAPRHFSRRWRRARKYNKWQHQKSYTTSGPSSRIVDTGWDSVEDAAQAVSDEMDCIGVSGAKRNADRDRNGNDTSERANDVKLIKELDILYENQRGCFLFGVPLYSQKSLLNYDPSAWVTKDLKNSPVNITNAQLPDPSWQWAWHTWYVDMSGDIDEHGWQYSWSFSSSSWHGNHPWFHSFVRRRRWVRMRFKKSLKTAPYSQSDLEGGHMLGSDYFTIHTDNGNATMSDMTLMSRLPSNPISQTSAKADQGAAELEDITDISTLMYALRVAVVDREKLEALKQFVRDGGEELYYLDQVIPKLMATLVYQASRWDFFSYLTDAVDQLSQNAAESEETERRHANLAKAAETAKRHIQGPDVFGDINRASTTKMLDLSPMSKQSGLLSQYAEEPINDTDHPAMIIETLKRAGNGDKGHIY